MRVGAIQMLCVIRPTPPGLYEDVVPIRMFN